MLGIAVGLVAVLGLGGSFPTATAEELPAPTVKSAVRYGRDIRPLLSDRCFVCHGPDAAKREANLRLDVREDATATRKGVTPIVPGNPDRSDLWKRITSHDEKEAMPPASANKRPFSESELALIKAWIEEGAPYESHWAFAAPTRPPVPTPSSETPSRRWAKNDIDRFILAELEANGERPSEEADRATLVRRAFLDLTGLPPTPEEIESFLNDSAPDSFERLIDRLLTEEPYRSRYAERMTAPWLDAARYADTCGIHMDAGRSIWLWRDWVIDAYRDNMRFDRFVVEQIAGDLLPDATTATRVASGFHRNHVTTDEGGAIAEEYLVEYAVDRVSTTGSVFLGLTLGCARCHDHKYDPISASDFYGLYAYFNSIEEPGLYSQLPDPKRAFEPFLSVPSAEQETKLTAIGAKLAEARASMQTVTPEELAQRDAFLASGGERLGIRWTSPSPSAAKAEGGAAMTIADDGAIHVSGENPAQDEYEITYRVTDAGARALLLEALTDPTKPDDRVGRSDNGNVVMTGIHISSRSVTDPTKTKEATLAWAWADVSQNDGDWDVTNLLAPGAIGWAVGGQHQAGGRVAVFLANEPFGFDGGAEVTVKLAFRSPWIGHAFKAVRLSFAQATDESFATLPEGFGRWLVAGPFPVERREDAFAKEFGPELDTTLLPLAEFQGGVRWNPFLTMRDAEGVNLDPGVSATYVGRRIFSPSARSMPLALGSDDGLRVYVNGKQVFAREVDRSIAPDQETIEIPLERGMNTLVMKVANTGGPGAIFHRIRERPDVLNGALAGALVPQASRPKLLADRMAEEWIRSYSPHRRQVAATIAQLERDEAAIRGEIPLTMVMKELPQPRETFVLKRGQYDLPDRSRPVKRGVPAALGALPSGAPDNRRGLAQWLVAPENPLVARVTINRLWEQVFGNGIVRTTEDFGLQGDWPTHPELLDWLAVEFRESGWDVQHMLKLMMTSATYRQSAAARKELVEKDPENRLLGHFQRKRLSAEQIRDGALFNAGLLVERQGGPSVKPYQPAGLWEEVAMLQSNTRIFQRGTGDDLWRRSIYTYWKRASPPPSMLTFDAPTRENCVVRRSTTNTPLQALALWNDEQFIEASRVLAARTLIERSDDGERIARLFERCTGHRPDQTTAARLKRTLDEFRARYIENPDDAKKLLTIGDAPVPTSLDPSELAAWTLLSNAVLNLDSAITRD